MDTIPSLSHLEYMFSLSNLRTEGVIIVQIVKPTEAEQCLTGFDDCLGE